jgi:hypothetical protein
MEASDTNQSEGMPHVQIDVETLCELLDELNKRNLTVLTDSYTDSCNLPLRVKIVWRITGFLDFFHRPVFQRIENTTIRKLDLFPASGEKTPTQFESLETANLSHWTTPVRFTQLFTHVTPG